MLTKLSNTIDRFADGWRLLHCALRLWSSTPAIGWVCLFWLLFPLALWWPCSDFVVQWIENNMDRDASNDVFAGVFLNLSFTEVLAVFLGAAVVHLIVVMFQFAVTEMAVTRLDRQEPKLSDAWDALLDHSSDIWGLSMVNSLVSAAIAIAAYALAKINELFFDSRWGAKAVDAAADAAQTIWYRSTSLTVPALVMNPGFSAHEAVQESMHLFAQTWGENLAGDVAIDVLTRVLGFFVFSLWTASCYFYLPSLHSFTYINGMVVIGWVTGVFSLLVSTTFNAVLYRYARFGEVPDSFDPSDLSYYSSTK